MQRVTRSSAVASMPALPVSPGPPGFFTGGNPGTGVPATVPGQEWFNGVQEELIAILARAGVTPSASDLTQVRRALDRLHGGGFLSLSASATLTADDAGLVLIDATGGARTVTLPAAGAAGGRPLQFRLVRTDGSANAVTIQRAGSDVFLGGATSVTIPRNGSLMLSSDGVGTWHILGEHARGRSIGANGWIVHPGGLIQQWGSITLGSANIAVGAFAVLSPFAFPLAFPTACLNASGITHSPGSTTFEDHEMKLTVSAITASQITFATTRVGGAFSAGDTFSVLWQAIGW
jgi:hypothetical protein